MNKCIFIMIAMTTTFIFYMSLIPMKETLSTTEDNNKIEINNSENLRDFFEKMLYICNLDSNGGVDKTLGFTPTVCYKINRLYLYLNQVKDLLDAKTEAQIMDDYGPKQQQELAGQPVGNKPPLAIIGSNEDYRILIKLLTYAKMLEPYNEMKIWSKNEEGSGPSVTSHCNYTDIDSMEFVKCANKMLKDITKLLQYFHYQTESNPISYGDTSDTLGGAFPTN